MKIVILVLFSFLVLWLGYLAFLARAVNALMHKKYKAMEVTNFSWLVQRIGQVQTEQRSAWGHEVLVQWWVSKSGESTAEGNEIESLEVKGSVKAVPVIFGRRPTIFLCNTLGSTSMHFFKLKNGQIVGR